MQPEMHSTDTLLLDVLCISGTSPGVHIAKVSSIYPVCVVDETCREKSSCCFIQTPKANGSVLLCSQPSVRAFLLVERCPDDQLGREFTIALPPPPFNMAHEQIQGLVGERTCRLWSVGGDQARLCVGRRSCTG